MLIGTWYIPSYFGDIKLEATGEKSCRLIAENTTSQEKAAIAEVAEYAKKKKWVPTESGILTAGTTEISAPIKKVQERLIKAMKVGREIVSAVMISGGKMQEIRETSYVQTSNEPSGKKDPSLLSRAAAAVSSAAESVKEALTPAPAVSVAKPHQGCPAPDFPSAEQRASAVLRTFLDAEQIEDFEKYNRFISIGVDTGHRYMITSRTNRDSLAQYQRTLFDLDEKRPLCVHDWEVPAPEEMLGLHVMLQLPGHEAYLRHLE